MFAQQYYHGIIRKYVIAFGNLFNDIVIQRLDKNQEKIQSIAVPIAYGPKEKWLARFKSNPKLEKNIGITLPRIGFEISSLLYSPTRKLSSTIREISLKADAGSSDDLNKFKTQFVPVPYDIVFMLYIFVRNADDGAQILEQILPYFRPEFTTNVRLIPEMNTVIDTPIVLQDVTIEDTYEGDFDIRRALIYTLSFNMKAQFYGPVTSTGVIKRAITNFRLDMPSDTLISEKMTITPSMFANGAPLHSPSANSALSVGINQISSDDDYGFTTVINTNIDEINE